MMQTSTPFFSHYGGYSNNWQKLSDFADVFGYLNKNEMKVSNQTINKVIGFAKSIGVMKSEKIKNVEYNLN